MKTRVVSAGKFKAAKNVTAVAVNMPTRKVATDTAKSGGGGRIGLKETVGLETVAVTVEVVTLKNPKATTGRPTTIVKTASDS